MLYALCIIAGAIGGMCLASLFIVGKYNEDVTDAYEKGRTDERAKILTEVEEKFVG